MLKIRVSPRLVLQTFSIRFKSFEARLIRALIFFGVYRTIIVVIQMQTKVENPKTRKKLSDTAFFRVFRVVRSVLVTVVLLTLVAVIALTVISRIQGKTPSLFGYSIFRVSSGSMKPAYEVGDVILVKACDPLTVREGDIVTYYGKSAEMAGKIVTHRVVKAPFEQNGEYYITTRGDANSADDPNVKTSDVIGITEKKMPFLTVLYNYFATPWGLLTIIALIIAAFFNEIINFVKSLLGIGYEEEKGESVEEIIERYQRESLEKQRAEAAEAEAKQSEEYESSSS